MLKGFRLTLGFLTRIPVRIDWDVKEGELEKGIIYFPVVGIVLGVFCAMVYSCAHRVFPMEIAILFGMLTLVFLTGAFHVDGLADTADGIYSARSREQILEIMKDSRVGTNGVIAILFDFTFRYGGLWMAGHFFNRPLWLVFLLLPVAGKMVQGIVGYKAVYARKEGLGLFIGTLDGMRTFICSLLGNFILTVGFGLYGFLASLAVFLLIFLFRKYIERILGGLTGDIMGAANEVAEIGFLLFLFFFMNIC
ncbi:MAG: adenosylcobinamide-GDP ribazoletransferase [Lachnospiraceae bacterium]|nr:adenosylcobinamide-GDP ribazoletransferase [Lachnospiraceae bacterium]